MPKELEAALARHDEHLLSVGTPPGRARFGRVGAHVPSGWDSGRGSANGPAITHHSRQRLRVSLPHNLADSNSEGASTDPCNGPAGSRATQVGRRNRRAASRAPCRRVGHGKAVGLQNDPPSGRSIPSPVARSSTRRGDRQPGTRECKSKLRTNRVDKVPRTTDLAVRS